MTAITRQLLVDAVRQVERMSFNEREQLADEIYAEQPNLLASIIVLQNFGAALEQMEVVLNLLLVIYSAMKVSGKSWPVISEGVQDRCLKRITAGARAIEKLPSSRQQLATDNAIAEHRERELLAYAYGKLREQRLLGIRTEAEKMIVLTSMNLVECVAAVAPRSKGNGR
jgi:hypothetical protein